MLETKNTLNKFVNQKTYVGTQHPLNTLAFTLKTPLETIARVTNRNSRVLRRESGSSRGLREKE